MTMTEHDYEQVREEIKKILPQPGYDAGSAGPILVRLAWHCSGTYDKQTNTGGSNGATMRYAIEANDPANAGLEHAREFLEPVKRKFPWISYGDLWTLAGVVALEEMGGPRVAWRGGRLDHTDDSNVPPNGRLPDASQGCPHLRDVFYRMNFSDQEIVALSGAHTLGQCHADRSGFDGPWVRNPIRFSNTYFKLLLAETWTPKINVAGNLQFRDEDDEIMMLPTDMALLDDPKFAKWVKIYAEDKERFFEDFAGVFGKLIELGVQRDEEGNVVKKGMDTGDKRVWVEGAERETEVRLLEKAKL
ncbi:heme peroxidase [Saitoella coloradoensis]